MDRLRSAIPEARLIKYVAATTGTIVDPMDLYRWSSRLSLAVFDALATVEVALRSAMAQSLAVRYGLNWFQRDDLLDDETLKLIQAAWTRGRLHELAVAPEVLHGKLVATLMFGFWVKILGRGGYQGRDAARQRRIYDTVLWKEALRTAFPNVGDTDRARVEHAARRVQTIRNRVAHHEHLIWGVPMPGQTKPDGTTRRISVADAHRVLLELAGYLNTDLRLWIEDNSAVAAVAADCPLPKERLNLG